MCPFSFLVEYKDEFNIGWLGIESLVRPFTGIIVHLEHSTSDETDQGTTKIYCYWYITEKNYSIRHVTRKRRHFFNTYFNIYLSLTHCEVKNKLFRSEATHVLSPLH